jgi:hypothetical protein
LEAQSKQLVIGLDEKHMPDIHWLITSLGTLNADHMFFRKDYKPKHEIVHVNQHEEYIDDEEGFFIGLDTVPNATKSKR